MPCLHYSNRLDRLIVPLAQELDKRNPFDTVEIVVPNFSLEKWISLKLAQYQGIAANLNFITLEKAIYQSLKNSLQNRYCELLKQETIQCLLMDILREKLGTADRVWNPVRSYLSPEANINSEAAEHRLFQLSGRLSYLFKEYEYSRNEELIATWNEGRNAIDQQPLGTENWQRTLWNDLFGAEGKLTFYNRNISDLNEAELQTEIFTLPQLYRICRDRQKNHNSDQVDPVSGPETGPLHIFGVSYLSRFHQNALTEYLAHLRDIHVYTLNPCMEFWEDVQSLGEARSAVRRSLESNRQLFENQKSLSETEILQGELFQHEDDNPFLQAWGRPGRENIRLLNQWSDWNFEPWFAESTPLSTNEQHLESPQPSILNQIQHDILCRKPRRSNSLNLEQDDSLVVLACANPRREVEAVANMIWDLIRNDPDLKLNDCAVITHEMELYQHEIEQVFESIHDLPYHLIDGISGSAGRLEDAANSLLGLCFTEYSRRDLFKLINNPCFLRKFEENEPAGKRRVGEELQIDQWLKWADELNVFFGIDNESQKEHGYHHLDKNIYHWEQAFRRLTLGEMIAGDEKNETIPNASQNLIPADLPDELSAEAARFMLIVRSLIADTRDLPEWKMKGKEWGLYLHTLIKTYLKPISEADKEVFQNLLHNAVSINDLDKGQLDANKLFGFSTIYEFFKQKQKKALLHRGHYLAEGVTVSSFQPMRPIPFKAVFLLGMGEGLFPTPYHRDTLDLRHIPVRLNPAVQGHAFRERRLGDVSVTERDRYMFLETLVSTGKHLVMSYVSRNDRTDDELNPSSIIQTLIDELENGYLKEKFRKIEHPLKSYSLEYFPELTESESVEPGNKKSMPNYDPAALRQARALRLRELFDHKFPGFQRISPEFIPDELKHSSAGQFYNEASQESASNNRISSVSISRLRKFLESPLQSTASHLLGMAEDEEDIGEKTEEPLALDRLSEWSLLRKIWDNSLKSVETEHDWPRLYHHQTQRMLLEGEMPGGVFGEANQAKHIRVLKSWQTKLTSALETNWETLTNNIFQFHFGGLREESVNNGISGSYRFVRPPSLQIENSAASEAEKTSMEIHGKTEWWYTDDSKNWKCIYFCERQSKEKDWLRHFLDVLILREANIIPDGASVTGLCIAAEGRGGSRKINLPSKEQSKEYLATVAQEINNENNAVLMPVESVLELSKENLSGSEYNARFNEWMDRKLHHSSGNMGISSQYGPVKFLEDVPFPENPYQLMNSRFGLFFDTVST